MEMANGKKTYSEVAKELLLRPAPFVIMLGLIVLILGLSGGFIYKDYHLPITGVPQYIGIAVGVLAISFGIFKLFQDPEVRPHGIAILSPRDESVPARVTVTGSIRRPIPGHHELWIVRVYRDGEFTPVRRVDVRPHETTWSIRDVDVGGLPGERRRLAAFLVNPAGQTLLEYFREAARIHNRWMDKLNIPHAEPDRFLPNLDRKTIDRVKIIDCDRVELLRV
jgi:hypothetical protein